MEYDIEKISNNVKNQKFRKNLFIGTTFTIIIFLFIINVIGLYKNIIEDEEDKNDIMGFYLFNIISGSMSPTIEKGDLIIVKKTSWRKLKENDIITFKQNNIVISHRIKRIIQKDQDIAYITKGDNNEVEDNFETFPNQVYGKQVYNIPKIGWIVDYVQDIKGLFNIIILISLIFIVLRINDKKKNRRRDKRRKYELKKIRENYNTK